MRRTKDYSVGLKLKISVWISALVFFSITPGAIGGSATLSNGTDVNIQDGTGIYAHSGITISTAPAGATVSRIDWSFSITHGDGRDLDVDLNDNTRTTAFHADLWRGTFLSGGTDSGVNPSRSGTITSGSLVGLPVNQTWYLAAADVATGDPGYINTWTITVYWVDSLPNLTSYLPPGWSDKIVVSRTTGTTTDSTSLTTADTLFVDWSVLNNGNAAAGAFYVYLYVDGTYRGYGSTSLSANTYTYWNDLSIGTLSAGTHTISITADATGAISESNEGDNSYTKTISVANVSQPNLAPYQPPGWSDKIVVSRAAGNNADSTSLTTADTLYVDWGVVNNGNAAAASSFSTYLYVDGAPIVSWSIPPLNANFYTAAFDFPIGSLSAGTHTITITADATGAIAESNEGDNSYTKTISIGGTALPDFQITSITLNPASPQPGQAFTANVTVKNQGSGSGDGKWLDVWVNQASGQACGTDGNTWAAVGTLTSGQSKTFTLNLTALASAGSYTFRAFVDSYCQTAESSEGDNQTTLTYTAGSTSPLPNFLVTAITFNPAQPVGGQPFTASVTVKNQGAVSGDGKYLDVWVNQPSSQACGAPGGQSQSVGTLSVNQAKTLTYNLTAPPSGAPWTFRAFVDSTCQTPESNDGDNQLTASYGINPVAQPDFTITSITISPSSLNPGDKFSASVTVKNLGTVSGNAGWLDVWANKPTAAACGESGNSYSTVGTLAAGESKVITVANLTAGPAGNNTLRAFIDSKCVSTESSEANNQKTFDYKTSQRVLVLLHGMNSNPDTWQDFVDDRFDGIAPIIYGGMQEGSDSPSADTHGVVCYRVRFGFYDAVLGRSGIESVSATGNKSKDFGDFSTFDTLGQEVFDAVNYILSVHPNAQVTLLGHSRGGIAARAFLQTATATPERSSVVALLTTGTPHKGSRLGRIYSYLADTAHPRTTDSSKFWKVDWDVADTVKAKLDVRRPTISDLSDESSAISSLSSSIINLPSSSKYGAITYTSVELGLLQRDVDYKGVHTYLDYSIFADATQTYSWVGPKVSTQAESHMLGSGSTPISYPGDGIVPVLSQRYDDISGFPGSTFTAFPHTGSTIHTEEPGQEAHISDALGSLIDW